MNFDVQDRGLQYAGAARIEGPLVVVERVREAAEQEGFDPDLGEALWRRLIEWSIEREEGQLSKLDGRGGVPGS